MLLFGILRLMGHQKHHRHISFIHSFNFTIFEFFFQRITMHFYVTHTHTHTIMYFKKNRRLIKLIVSSEAHCKMYTL